MISIVKITDKDNLPCRYASRLDAFSNGREYVFRPGVNIIVGNNGCGKTTLIRMIADFTFCDSSMLSKIPDAGYKFPPIIVAELSPAGEIYDDDILIIKTSHLIEFFPDYYSPTYGARFIIGARLRQYLRAADNNERRFLYDFIEKHAKIEE